MKLTPANSTRTSASPSPGKPPDAFSTERTSGPPNLDTLTTRTCSHPFLPLIAPRPRLLAPDRQPKSAPPIADKRHPWVSASRNRHERNPENNLQVTCRGRVASPSTFPHHRIRIVLGPGGLQLNAELHCITHQHAPSLQGTV